MSSYNSPRGDLGVPDNVVHVRRCMTNHLATVPQHPSPQLYQALECQHVSPSAASTTFNLVSLALAAFVRRRTWWRLKAPCRHQTMKGQSGWKCHNAHNILGHLFGLVRWTKQNKIDRSVEILQQPLMLFQIPEIGITAYKIHFHVSYRIPLVTIGFRAWKVTLDMWLNSRHELSDAERSVEI